MRTQDIYIPEPTVTEGVVSLLPTKKDQQANADVKTYDTVGNTYQLDILCRAGLERRSGAQLGRQGDRAGFAALKLRAACCLRSADMYVHELLQPQRNAQ